MLKNVITLSVLALAWSNSIFAQQDKHFSMWMENPTLMNPATAGAMNEDIRFMTNMRMQWLPLNGENFRTNSFGIDAKLFKNRSGSHLGLGLNFVNDATGDLRLTSNIISVPISYTIAADKNTFISLGIAPGFYQQAIKNTNSTWNNQWDGSTYNQTIMSGESFSPELAVSTFDIGAGLHVNYKFDASNNINVGVSVNHITAPLVSYSALENKLYRNANIYITGTRFMDDRNFGFSPQVLVSLFGPSRNILFGTYFDHEMFESSKRTDYVQRSFISYGVFMRYGDAIIGSLAYKFKGFKVGASYDFNISDLSSATRSSGGFEIFLKFSTMTDRSSYIHDRKLFRWNRGTRRL
jgi:type IX secretion system PorP/SprF family membrane protein